VAVPCGEGNELLWSENGVGYLDQLNNALASKGGPPSVEL